LAGGREVRCGAEACSWLCEALRGYAAAAFPPGGSECAQASRASLMDMAERFAGECATTGGITVKGRQKGLLRGAVQVYFEELADLPAAEASRRRDALLALF
jgi:hypothetical protein